MGWSPRYCKAEGRCPSSGEGVNDRTHGQQFKARFLRTWPPTSAGDNAQHAPPVRSDLVRRAAQACVGKTTIVNAILRILAARCDPLTGCNGCGVPNNRHDVAMSARLGPQNTKAILGIMVRDALDETGKNFLRLILGLNVAT